MAQITALIEEQIGQHIANPMLLSSKLSDGKIQGKFRAANRVYNYVLTRKDLQYSPAGNMDSALFSALYLRRFDAVAKRPQIGKSNCTYKSYQCGKICLGLRRRCRKNVNDIERVAKIFYMMENDARTGKTIYDKAIANVNEADRSKVIARAQKMRNSESRGARAKELIKGRQNAKKTQTETGDQRVGTVRPNDGGSSGTGYLQPSTERIKVAREALTQPADPNLISERLRQHLNEFQIHGAALAIKSMDKQGGFLLADGTGVGKTRQLLAVAQTYADRGHKVLIVTANEVLGSDSINWKKGTYTGSFKNDSESMGVKANLIKGDSPMDAGQVHLSTYSNLGKLKGQIDKNTVVLYDEAHAMKNKDSATTKHGKAINNVAGKVLFATATPVDKILHMDYLERANVFSGMSRSQAYKHMGMELVDVRVRGGATIQAWQVPRGKAEEVLERMSGMFDQMTENGNMIKREISLKGVTTKFTDILVPQEAHDAMQAIEDKLASGADRERFKNLIDKRKQLNEAYAKDDGDPAIAAQIGRINNQLMDVVDDQGRAQVLMAQRRQIEPYKIPAAVESTNQALKEGKQVVVFLSRVNESDAKDIKGETLSSSEGTVKLLREQLIKSGIDPKLITELHGETNTKSADAQSAFQSGKAKVILATIESGGTGINLDDTKGDAPRHMIIMTPPFTAVQNLQAVGRIHRLNTKSESSVEYLFTNTSVDSWSRDITAEKMKTLGSAVAGESGKMSTRTVAEVKPHPDLDKTEYKPAPRPPKQITVADPTATAKELAATIQELHPTITANYWISTDGQKHRVYLEENGNKTGFIKLDKGNVSFDDVHPNDREQMQAYFEKYQKEGAPKQAPKPIVIEYRYRFGEKLAKKIQEDHPSLKAKYWTSPDGSKHRIYLKDNGRDGGYVGINPEGVDLANVRYGSDAIKKYSEELLKNY